MSTPSTTPHLSQLAFQLSQEGRHDQALDLLKRAHQSEPANPYLAVNLGFCAMAAGQSEEASAAFGRAEALFDPEQLASLPVLERLCQGWLLVQQPQRARALLERLAPLNAQASDVLIGLYASVATAFGEADNALTLYLQLQDPQPKDRICGPLSSLLICQGRLQEAETVLVNAPGTSNRADLITNLAILASEHGKVARARRFYLQALELEPQSFVPAYNLARFFFLQGEHERARAAVGQALERAPQAREGFQLLEQIESGAGNFEAALSVIGRWRQRHPNDLAAQIAQCRLHASLDQAEALAQMLPTLVSRCPGHPDLLALLAGLPANTRSLQGLSASLAACFEPQRQVQHHPALLADSLCDRLQALILSDPTLHAQRPHKPTRQGSQTHELFTNPLAEPLAELVASLRPQINAMIAAFDPEQRRALAYPSGSDDLEFSGWGVVLDRGGYQAPHGHPDSLFSGVVYLQVPEPECVPGQEHAPGSLCFYGDGVRADGASEEAAGAHRTATFSILPRRGDLILFPSYLWHGTVPFSMAGPRICLAFNVVPRSVVD